jgi:hypothetical protein
MLTLVQPPVAETPLARALRMYARGNRRLEVDLGQYVRGGYVVARPDLLLLFRPIRVAEPDTWLEDAAQADGWYVGLLAGAGGPRAAIREMPYHLPWCCWRRNFRHPGGPVHFVCTDKLVNKL